MARRNKFLRNILATSSAFAIGLGAGNAMAALHTTAGNVVYSTGANFALGGPIASGDNVLVNANGNTQAIDVAGTFGIAISHNITPGPASVTVPITLIGVSDNDTGSTAGGNMPLTFGDNNAVTLNGAGVGTFTTAITANSPTTYNRLGNIDFNNYATASLIVSGTGLVLGCNIDNSSSVGGMISVTGANNTFSGIIGATNSLGSISDSSGGTNTYSCAIITASSIKLSAGTIMAVTGGATITANIIAAGAGQGTVRVNTNNVAVKGNLGNIVGNALLAANVTDAHTLSVNGNINAPVSLQNDAAQLTVLGGTVGGEHIVLSNINGNNGAFGRGMVNVGNGTIAGNVIFKGALGGTDVLQLLTVTNTTGGGSTSSGALFAGASAVFNPVAMGAAGTSGIHIGNGATFTILSGAAATFNGNASIEGLADGVGVLGLVNTDIPVTVGAVHPLMSVNMQQFHTGGSATLAHPVYATTLDLNNGSRVQLSGNVDSTHITGGFTSSTIDNTVYLDFNSAGNLAVANLGIPTNIKNTGNLTALGAIPNGGNASPVTFSADGTFTVANNGATSDILSTSPNIGTLQNAGNATFSGSIGQDSTHSLKLLNLTGTAGQWVNIASATDIWAQNIIHTGMELAISQNTLIHGNYTANNATLVLGNNTLTIAPGTTVSLSGTFDVHANYTGTAPHVALDLSGTNITSNPSSITLHIDSYNVAPQQSDTMTVIAGVPNLGGAGVRVLVTSPDGKWQNAPGLTGMLIYNPPAQNFTQPAGTVQVGGVTINVNQPISGANLAVFNQQFAAAFKPGNQPMFDANTINAFAQVNKAAFAGSQTFTNFQNAAAVDMPLAHQNLIVELISSAPTQFTNMEARNDPSIKVGAGNAAVFGAMNNGFSGIGSQMFSTMMPSVMPTANLQPGNFQPANAAGFAPPPQPQGNMSSSAGGVNMAAPAAGNSGNFGDAGNTTAGGAARSNSGDTFGGSSAGNSDTTGGGNNPSGGASNKSGPGNNTAAKAQNGNNVNDGTADKSTGNKAGDGKANGSGETGSKAEIAPTADALAAGVAAGEGISYGEGVYDRFGLWGSINGGSATQKWRKGNPGFRSFTHGASVGIDTMLDERNSIGFAVSNTINNVKYKDAKTGDKTHSTSWMGAVYGNHQINDRWFVRGTGVLTQTRIHNQDLKVTGVNSFGIADSKYNVLSYGADVSVGMAHMFQNHVIVSPTAGLRISRSNKVTYNETGNTGQNSTTHQDSMTSFSALGGLQISQTFEREGIQFTPDFHANLQYGLGVRGSSGAYVSETAPLLTTKFVGTKAPKFSSGYGVGLTGSSDRIECGISADMSLATGYVGYQGSLKLKVKF